MWREGGERREERGEGRGRGEGGGDRRREGRVAAILETRWDFSLLFYFVWEIKTKIWKKEKKIAKIRVLFCMCDARGFFSFFFTLFSLFFFLVTRCSVYIRIHRTYWLYRRKNHCKTIVNKNQYTNIFFPSLFVATITIHCLWCHCGVVVLLWCCSGGVVLLWCGGVVLLWWCGVTVVVWCYCGGVVLLWWYGSVVLLW